MRLRHGTVTDSGPGWALVSLDGVDVEVLVSAGQELPLGSTAACVQDGRRLVALGAPAL